MAGNIFQDGMDAFNSTNEAIQGIQKRRAQYQAAPMVASGNFSGAAQAYGAAGLPDEARQSVVDQQTMDARAKQQALEDTQRKADALLKVSKGLRSVPTGQRKAALETLTPLWQKLNIDPSMFNQLDEAHLTDQSLDAFDASLGKAAEEYTLGQGQVRYRGTQEVARGPEPDQKYMPVPAGGALVPVPRGGQAAPAAGAPALPPSPAAAPHDPGSLSAPLTALGARVTSGVRTPAHNAEVGGVPNSRHLTGDAVDLVPPPGMTLAQLGDEARRRVPGATVIVENDHVHVQSGGARPAQAAPSDGLPPGTIRGPAKPPEWTSDGRGHLVNANGDRKIDPTAGADVAADPNLVKAIINGTAPAPTAARQATDPKWQAAYAEAMAQDPTLDAANYGTRVKTRADFATGTAAKTKTALNTALGHAGDLDGQVDALHNSPIRGLNKVGNLFATETGDPRVKTFNLTKEALLHEAMKVFSGSQGSMTEFAQLSENLNVNDSPAQQHSVIRKLVALLASKMDALGEQYKTGMGKELDQSQIMSPHAQQVFNKISGVPGAAGAPSVGLPPQARAQLKPGHNTTFANGQTWTVQNGQPVRVN